MKCPKCGFNSFDYLESCKKCGNDLKEFKSKFSLRSLIYPGSESVAPVMGESLAVDDSLASPASNVAEVTDFGYDLEDGVKPAAEPAIQSAGEEGEDDSFDLDWNEDSAEEFDFADEREEDATLSDPLADEAGRNFDFEPEEERGGPPIETSPVAGEATNDESELSWDEDPLPDLSLPAEEELEFESLGDEPPVDLPGEEPAGKKSGIAEDGGLPGLNELDFDELSDTEELDGLSVDDSADEDATWGEISFEDDEEKKDKGSTGAKEEGPSDPFDQPESAIMRQAPDSVSVFPSNSLSQLDLPWSAEENEDCESLENSFADHPSKSPEPGLLSADAPGEVLEALPEPLKAADEGRVAAAEKAGVASNPPSVPEPDVLSALLPAGLVARFGALCLDIFLVTGVLLLFLVIGTRLLAPADDPSLLPSLHVLLTLSVPYYLLLVSLCFLYFTVFHFFLGQTPGKMLFGIRVEGADGQPLLLSEAFLRSVGGLASLVALGLGFFLACRDPEGRGWNDRLAGTRVVAEPEEV